jgi:hypothetical protein
MKAVMVVCRTAMESRGDRTGGNAHLGWGKSKVHFRHNNNYSPNATNLEERVKESMNTAGVLTLARVRKFQRKANDYKRAYLALAGDEATEIEHKDIEAMKKKCKTHRCTLDQDYAFIKCA